MWALVPDVPHTLQAALEAADAQSEPRPGQGIYSIPGGSSAGNSMPTATSQPRRVNTVTPHVDTPSADGVLEATPTGAAAEPRAAAAAAVDTTSSMPQASRNEFLAAVGAASSVQPGQPVHTKQQSTTAQQQQQYRIAPMFAAAARGRDTGLPVQHGVAPSSTSADVVAGRPSNDQQRSGAHNSAADSQAGGRVPKKGAVRGAAAKDVAKTCNACELLEGRKVPVAGGHKDVCCWQKIMRNKDKAEAERRMMKLVVERNLVDRLSSIQPNVWKRWFGNDSSHAQPDRQGLLAQVRVDIASSVGQQQQQPHSHHHASPSDH